MIAIKGATGRTGRVIAEALLGGIHVANVQQVVSLCGLGAHEPPSTAKGGKGVWLLAVSSSISDFPQ
jgi:hypothetical protein